MSASGFTTIECPNCHRSLPPNAQNCHFCGASLANVARPAPVVKPKYRPAVEPWILTLYKAVACYWIVDGLWDIVDQIIQMTTPHDPKLDFGLHIVATIVIPIGLFIILLGVGLLMKWEWTRGVVNVFCWIRIVWSLWTLKNLVLGGFLFMSPLFLIGSFIFAIVSLVAAGTQVWLLAETD